MKKSTFYNTFFIILIGILFGCVQKENNIDVEADIAAITGIYDQYFIFVNNGDMDRFISLWTEDAIRMAPDFSPMIGRENIRTQLKDAFEQLKMGIGKYGDIEVEVCKDLAYARGNFILKTTPKEGGTTTVLDGKWLGILKRQPDGSWLIYIDCFNNNPTLSLDSIPQELREKNPYY